MRTTTLTFDGPRVRATKTVPCSTCGCKVRRQRTFRQYVNPFNRNAGGVPKTWDEVRADVEREAAEWKAQPEECTHCRGDRKKR